jgi:hypothetical protein
MEGRELGLRRGDSLWFNNAAGASVTLAEGEAWLSHPDDTWDWSLREGVAKAVRSDGSMMVYAFRASRILLVVPRTVEVRVRRRGQVPEVTHGVALTPLHRWLAYR